MDKILSQAGEKSADREIVDGVLNVVCFLLQRVLENASSGKAPDEAVKLVESFIGKLAADTLHAALRLKVHRLNSHIKKTFMHSCTHSHTCSHTQILHKQVFTQASVCVCVCVCVCVFVRVHYDKYILERG